MNTERSLRVLVVDDEPTLSAALAAVLTRRGHEVEVARAAHEALALETPEVLITDLRLPGASGLDLLSSFHSRGDRPHTIVVTGDPTAEDCRRALLLGAAEFLAKPFRIDALVDAVERAPRRRDARATASSGARFDKSYVSLATSVEFAARDIIAFAVRCGLGPACRARVGSALAEIVDNAHRHAYPRAPGEVRVQAALEAGDLVVRVTDTGLGFESGSARSASSPRRRSSAARSPSARPPSAQRTSVATSGMARASSWAEDLRIESQPGSGTRVTLRFRAGRADFGEGVEFDLSEHDFLTPELARRVLRALQKRETSDLFQLSPAIAVVVGRLLSGPDLHTTERAFRS